MRKQVIPAAGPEPMDITNSTPEDPGAHRLALVDELDLLVKVDRDRRGTTVVLGLLTLCVILVLETWTWRGGLGAVISLGLLLAVMIKPIRRIRRIHELERDLDGLDTASGGRKRLSGSQ